MAYRSHFRPIPDSPLTVLQREQAEAAAAAVARVPIPISSSPLSNSGGRVARRDGQVTQVAVVCCERANRYLQQHSYIYIWGKVRDILPQYLSPFLTSL